MNNPKTISDKILELMEKGGKKEMNLEEFLDKTIVILEEIEGIKRCETKPDEPNPPAALINKLKKDLDLMKTQMLRNDKWTQELFKRYLIKWLPIGMLFDQTILYETSTLNKKQGYDASSRYTT